MNRSDHQKRYHADGLKHIGKKITVCAVGAIFAIGALFAAVGCNSGHTTGPNHSANTNHTPTPEPDPEPAPSSITFDEFLADHNYEARMFVSNYVEPNVIKGNVLGKECYISANEDDELDEVDFVSVYKVDDTKRAIEIATVTLSSPIDLDEIVDGTASVSGAALDVKKTTAFEFDAKENYFNGELSNSLYNAAKASSEKLKLFVEVESPISNARFFDIFTKNEEKISIVELGAVSYSNTTDERFMNNLADPNKFYGYNTLISYPLKGVNIYSENYQLEVFENSGTDDPNTDDGKQITDAELIDSLTQNCADTSIKKALAGINIDKKNISNEKWYVTFDNDNKIIGAEYTFWYRRSNTDAMFVVCSVTFAAPISRVDLKNGKLGNVTYKTEYSLNYNSSIQETRKDLTNAILNACADELTEGSIRILVDDGTTVDNRLASEAHRFSVVEITDKGIQQINVVTKETIGDERYILNFSDESKFYISGKQIYLIGGEKLTEIDT